MDAPPAVPLAAMTDINTALIPVSRLELDSYDWFARHHAELQVRNNLQPQIVMVGDSITHFWGGAPYGTQARGPRAWKELFGETPVLNMGFGWDRVQNVLWRVQHGEFDGLTPAAVVINIGTNNLTGTEHARANTPAEVVEGIGHLCSELHRRSPKSRIVLMGIFPRNDSPNDPLRISITAVNAQLASRYAHQPGVQFVDIGKRFVRPDGTLRRDLLPDGTHPNDDGYQIWANALRTVLGPPSRS
ncbi:MAG: GDSL-type esterase/lipase family protein [Janthinobacterium lividum]